MAELKKSEPLDFPTNVTTLRFSGSMLYTVRGCELLFDICAHLLYIYIYSINGSFQNIDFGICRIYVDIFRYSVYYQQTAFEDCFQEES